MQSHAGGSTLLGEQITQFDGSCSQVKHWGEHIFGMQAKCVEEFKLNIFGLH